jgi:hypothetical protein
MLTKTAKATFYALAGPLMRANALLYRAALAPDASKQGRLHLGPVQTKYIKGFINVDANIFTGKCDLCVDLRHPLPCRSETVAAVYAHHMIEHLPNLVSHSKKFSVASARVAYLELADRARTLP